MPDDLVVFTTFDQHSVNDDGEPVHTIGIVCSSPRLASRVEDCVRLQHLGVSLQGDGTYKLLYNGWVLSILATSGIKQAQGGVFITV